MVYVCVGVNVSEVDTIKKIYLNSSVVQAEYFAIQTTCGERGFWM